VADFALLLLPSILPSIQALAPDMATELEVASKIAENTLELLILLWYGHMLWFWYVTCVQLR